MPKYNLFLKKLMDNIKLMRFTNENQESEQTNVI